MEYMNIIIFVSLIILYYIFNYCVNNNDNKYKNIRTLIRQTARWAIASEQDESPMVAVLHANYAVGYLQALQDIYTENDINKFIDLQDFKYKLYKIQDDAVKKVVNICPEYVGDIDRELALVGISL
jgi:hypothetical protein